MEPVLLDACTGINLWATGVPLSDIAAASGLRFLMTPTAAEESIWLAAADGGDHRERIDIAREVALGNVELAHLDDGELVRFVVLASQVDDGEAATLAVAESRNLRVATDDRRAVRVAAGLKPPVETIGTTSLVRAWSESPKAGSQRLSEILQRIEIRASYQPRSDDPNRAWWSAER